jgi:thioredoxin-like negative regulator of GroEL
MKKYLMRLLFVVGSCLSSPLLYGQATLDNLQQIQFLSQNVCVVIQVNADWNKSASIDLGHVDNCQWFHASIDNKDYGAAIAKEWNIKSVPTIIMFEKGKEIKRFEAGLSFKMDPDDIKRKIEKEIDTIMLRRFQ